MKKIFPLLLLLLPFWAGAQTTISGTVSDTTNNKQLTNSVVSLLRKTDSVLVQFTRSGSNGNFLLKNVRPGDYLVFITHPTFGDYIDRLTITDSGKIALGSIAMTPKSKLLAEVIVRSANGAIRLKGDTIEYRADSFKTTANANVEALLNCRAYRLTATARLQRRARK
jgi:Carboxypeptidase regulatory-like domain